MPFVYDDPIGPTLPGTSVGQFSNGIPPGSLLQQAMKGAGSMLSGTPMPNLTGGGAGPSTAIAGDIKTLVNAVSGGSGMFWLGLTIIAGMLIWKVTKKK